jgi:hypothetical protein
VKDPQAAAQTGGNTSLIPLLFGSMIQAAVVDHAFIYAGFIEDEIVGVGIWFGPGQMLYST